MKKKETPFLDFYNECIKVGSIKPKVGTYFLSRNVGGLCSTEISRHEVFTTINPDKFGYWGHSVGYNLPRKKQTSAEDLKYAFTPLRQTIVLFCAAINNEL
jgi:hypothetical protein